MKKSLILIILLLMFPVVVNAESKYLYDVLKNEAENNGLAKEYTGEHHDSFTEEPSKKIYHWYAENDTEGEQVLEKNNAIFANFCWQIIRTTDTGGVKLIYNGTPTDGKCKNKNGNQSIGNTMFNEVYHGMIYVGYMINEDNLYLMESTADPYNITSGKDVSYNNGVYTLNNTHRGIDDGYHYTCGNNSTTCEKVHYHPTAGIYIVLENGDKIDDAINKMLYSEDVNKDNSTVKSLIDDWYRNHMLEYTDYIEDTVFCNDRKINDLKCWDSNGPKSGMMLFNNYNPTNDLNCSYITDKFSVSNEKAKLEYPVGLMTVPEMNLLNNNTIRKTGNTYLLLNPSYYLQVTGITFVDITGIIYKGTGNNKGDVRPAISLKPNSRYSSGDGSRDNPYIIDLTNYYKVLVDKEEKKGDIEFEIEDISNLPEGTEVKFKITPNKGYELKELKIIDEENNNVEYTTKDKINFKFTMPATDVTIKPQYKEINNIPNNPNTKRQILLIVISVIILSIMTLLYVKKKKRHN